MATDQQVAELRKMTHEPSDKTTFTDDELSGIIDRSSSLNRAAETVWVQKAGRFSGLVDVREGASSRALGDLYEQALKMAETYREIASSEETSSRATITRRIVREATT